MALQPEATSAPSALPAPRRMMPPYLKIETDRPKWAARANSLVGRPLKLVRIVPAESGRFSSGG